MLALLAPVATLALAAAPADDSFEALMKRFDTAETEALHAITVDRYDALLAYVDAGTGDDLERAHHRLIELAGDLDRPMAVVDLADGFAAAFPESKSHDEVLGLKAAALGETDRVADGHAILASLAEKAEGGDKADAYLALAGYCMTHLDVEGARAAYAALKTANETMELRGLDDYIDRQLADLEQIGQAPTPFPAVSDHTGQPLSLDDYKGKVVLVDFWATWCGPCIAELPNVLDTYAKYHDKGFEIVGISLDSDEEAFESFIAERGMTWRHHFDGQGWNNEIAQAYGVRSIPATYLLDTEGNVVRVGLRGEALGEVVGSLLD